jgi:hypothetical protein
MTNDERRAEEWKADYFALCDAVCRESTGVEDACRQARDTRDRLAAAETLLASRHQSPRVAMTASDTGDET